MSNSVRQDIQQLRGLAILFVVAYHAGGILPSGFVGVDVFFVVSGYVVMRSALRRIGEGKFTFSDFVGQRVRRILPALGLMLIVVISLSTWMSSIVSRLQTVRTGVFAALGGANLFLYRFRPDGYFVSSEKNNALLHTWSLSLEEQFYFLFGLAVLLIVRFAKKSRFVQLATGWGVMLGLLSFALCVASSSRGIPIDSSFVEKALGADLLDAQFAFYMPITRAWQFLIGVAIGLHSRIDHLSRVGSLILRLFGVSLVLISGILTPEDDFPSLWALLPTIGAGAVIIGGDSSVRVAGKLGALMSWLGDRSYGWYLWHWPLVQFATPYSQSRLALSAAALAALVPAHLSYRFLEQPVRSNAFFRQRSRTGWLAATCVLVPLVAAGFSSHPEPSLDEHLDVRLGCVYGEISRLGEDGPCTLTISDSRGAIALIGDSHASHLSEAFVAAAHDLGFDALLATRANNPFLYLEGVARDGGDGTPERIVQYLIERNIDLAVIAQATYPISYQDGKDWIDGMRPVIQKLTSSGINVVLVAESINVGADPQDCSALQIRLSLCSADVSRSTSQLLSQRGRIQQEVELVRESEAVVHFDSATYLCPDERCGLRRANQWWWRDNGHISVFASQQLSEPLEIAMAQALDMKS